MKNLFLAVVCLGVLFTSCTEDKKTGNTQISGEIKGLKQGTLYLQQVKDSTLVTLDSIVLKGSSNFESTFYLSEPEVLYLGLNRGTTKTMDNVILFFAEPGKMKITSSLDNFSNGAVIEGSRNQELYAKYLKSKSTIMNNQTDLIKEVIIAQQSKLFTKADSLDNLVKRNGARAYLHAVNFALKNNKHQVAPYVTLTEVATVHNKYLDTIYNNLAPDISKSKYGVILKNHIDLIKK